MALTIATALRRATRLMRPMKLTKATRLFHKALTGQLITAVLAPLTAINPKGRKLAGPKVGRALGAVLAQLAVPGAKAVAAPRVPKGAQYLTRTHRNAAGSRGYKLYIPARPVKGLIVMLHGCHQTADDFATGTHMNALGEKHGLVIAYPSQTKTHNQAGCWNWFRSGDQARGKGEPAMLASLARRLAGEFGLRRDAVFVAGLSAGGAMAAILADVYSDVFSAAGVHSGLARGAAVDVMQAVTAMRKGGVGAGMTTPASAHVMRRIIFHGDDDSTVHPSNAAQIVAQALGDTAKPIRTKTRSTLGRGYQRQDFASPDGAVLLELWMLHGTGHAWSGGRVAGSYTDARGPDASAQMVRFFLQKSA